LLKHVPTQGSGRIWSGASNPSEIFDVTQPLNQAAKGYRAMDERRAIEALLTPYNVRGTR
jgi:hypothetical protein